MHLDQITVRRFTESQPMGDTYRFNLVVAVAVAALLTGGCATEFKPLQFPDPVVLQQPTGGMAVVYIMRTAHDSPTVDVFLNGVRTAQLPKESYAILELIDPAL